MYITAPEAQEALDSLVSYNLIEMVQSRDTFRYYHVLWKTLKLSRQAIPILGILLLMGPLTVKEIRHHIARVYNYADAQIIKSQLRKLSSGDDPLVMMLPPMENRREERWAQLLTGKIEQVPVETPPLSLEILLKQIVDLNNRLTFLEDRLGIKPKVL
jgi:uncharacterized protein YceH (UPF0502 family)